MNRLKRFCVRVRDTHGMNHQLMLHALRNYIKETKTEQLEGEIAKLDDFNLLRAMQEAGVPKRVFNTYIAALTRVR